MNTMNPRTVMANRDKRIRAERLAVEATKPTLVLAYTSSAQPAKTADSAPVHEHDCNSGCTFLGNYTTKAHDGVAAQVVDMYACEAQNTGIARYGTQGDYYSGNVLGAPHIDIYEPGTYGHAMVTANRLGLKAGLLHEPLWRTMENVQREFEQAWRVNDEAEIARLEERMGELTLEARERAADGDDNPLDEYDETEGDEALDSALDLFFS